MSKCAYCKQEKGKLFIKSVDVCTSCNAHGRDYDTLKAKAELLDEAVTWMALLKEILNQVGDTQKPSTNVAVSKIDSFLSKTKEL